jgi:3-oxoadipate enol-lactonase
VSSVGERLGHTVDGPDDAPVLVLGPSLGTTRDMWLPQLPELSARFRVVRYDHLGHGDSDVPTGPYTVQRLARAVLSLTGELGVDRCHYAGVSLGGMVGMWLAAHAPERVDRLALLCTSAHLPPAQGWRDRAEQVLAHGTGSISQTVAGRWFTPAFPDVAPYAAMVAATPAAGYAACCLAIAEMDQRPVLDRITADTLVISGHDDPATPPEHGRTIAAGIGAGARFIELADAAHLANVERPAEVTRLLLDHLGGTHE